MKLSEKRLRRKEVLALLRIRGCLGRYRKDIMNRQLGNYYNDGEMRNLDYIAKMILGQGVWAPMV